VDVPGVPGDSRHGITTTSDHDPSVRTGRRIGEVDALRGFALFGILIANVIAVTGILSIQDEAFDFTYTFDSPVDQAVSTVVDAAFVGKFFVLFSFLFGYSFTLQLDAAARAQAPAVPRLLRRCAALFAIGAVHAALLWFGDILTLYAALGLLLVALRNVTPRTAVITAGCILLALAALQFLATSGGGDAGLSFLDVQALGEGYRGGPLDTLAAQLSFDPAFAAVIWFGQGPSALAMFLLGPGRSHPRPRRPPDRPSPPSTPADFGRRPAQHARRVKSQAKQDARSVARNSAGPSWSPPRVTCRTSELLLSYGLRLYGGGWAPLRSGRPCGQGRAGSCALLGACLDRRKGQLAADVGHLDPVGGGGQRGAQLGVAVDASLPDAGQRRAEVVIVGALAQ
jgi:hypothetical protein